MNKIKIGILGANGNIGQSLLKVIDKEKYSILSQSRTEGKTKNNHFLFDISNREELESFVELSDIIINCIAPSYKYSKAVYEIVEKYGKYYIDPFGASLISLNTVSGGVILSGECPGFTAVLLKYIYEHYFDLISKVEFLYKPSGNLSTYSMFDFMESVARCFGKVGHYYANKELIVSNKGKTNLRIKDKNYIAIDFITKECLALSNDLNINIFHFKNLFDSEEQIKKLMFYSINENDFMNIDTDKCYKFAGNETIYYINCIGIKDDIYKEMNFEISFNDSNMVSALIIKEVIDSIVIRDNINRFYFPYQVISISDFVENLIKLNIVKLKEYDTNVL